VKRECYSLARRNGQTEETAGVGGGHPAKLLWIFRANGGDLPERVRNPCGLVPLPSIWHRREVRRIRLHQKTVAGNHPDEIVVSPLLERHDAAEGDVPASGDRELGQGLGTGVAMENSDNSGALCLADQRSGVVFRVAGVDDDRTRGLMCQLDLRRERGALRVAGRGVVVVVQTTLTNSDRATSDESAQPRYVTIGVERCGIVGVNARGRKNEARVFRGDLRGDRGSLDRFADADDRARARIAGAGDYRVAVAGERCVREVGVAVDEACRAPVLRGHLRSIQRRTGAAT
jgi:hypothetical protein